VNPEYYKRHKVLKSQSVDQIRRATQYKPGPEEFEEVKMNLGSSQLGSRTGSIFPDGSAGTTQKSFKRKDINQRMNLVPFEDRGEWKITNTKVVNNFARYDSNKGDLSFKGGKFAQQQYLQPGKVWVKKGSSYFGKLKIL